LAPNFLIFTSFVSPLEKLRKRPQEIENQKVIDNSSYPMQYPGERPAIPEDKTLYKTKKPRFTAGLFTRRKIPYSTTILVVNL
jgi:hypothetical protein